MNELSVEQLCNTLGAMAGIKVIDPDEPIQNYGVDSLGFMSWLATLEEDLGVSEDELLERLEQEDRALGTITVQFVYDLAVRAT